MAEKLIPAVVQWGRENVSRDSVTPERITRVLEIEESIWSHQYGLKGIDNACICIHAHRSHMHALRPSSLT